MLHLHNEKRKRSWRVHMCNFGINCDYGPGSCKWSHEWKELRPVSNVGFRGSRNRFINYYYGADLFRLELRELMRRSLADTALWKALGWQLYPFPRNTEGVLPLRYYQQNYAYAEVAPIKGRDEVGGEAVWNASLAGGGGNGEWKREKGNASRAEPAPKRGEQRKPLPINTFSLFRRSAFMTSRGDIECVEVEQEDDIMFGRRKPVKGPSSSTPMLKEIDGKINEDNDEDDWLLGGKKCWCCPVFGSMQLRTRHDTILGYSTKDANVYEDALPVCVPFFDEYYVSCAKQGEARRLNKCGEVGEGSDHPSPFSGAATLAGSAARLRHVVDTIFRNYYDLAHDEIASNDAKAVAAAAADRDRDAIRSKMVPLERNFILPNKNFLSQKRDLHFWKWPIVQRLQISVYKRSGVIDVRFLSDQPQEDLTLVDAHCHLEIIWRKLPFRACERMTDRLLFSFHPESPYSLPNAWQLKTITSVCDLNSLDYWEKYIAELEEETKHRGRGGGNTDSGWRTASCSTTSSAGGNSYTLDAHLYFSIGVHPKSFVEYMMNERGMQTRLHRLADKLTEMGRLVAWGEIGLDYDADMDVPACLVGPEFEDDTLLEYLQRTGARHAPASIRSQKEEIEAGQAAETGVVSTAGAAASAASSLVLVEATGSDHDEHEPQKDTPARAAPGTSIRALYNAPPAFRKKYFTALNAMQALRQKIFEGNLAWQLFRTECEPLLFSEWPPELLHLFPPNFFRRKPAPWAKDISDLIRYALNVHQHLSEERDVSACASLRDGFAKRALCSGTLLADEQDVQAIYFTWLMTNVFPTGHRMWCDARRVIRRVRAFERDSAEKFLDVDRRGNTRLHRAIANMPAAQLLRGLPAARNSSVATQVEIVNRVSKFLGEQVESLLQEISTIPDPRVALDVLKFCGENSQTPLELAGDICGWDSGVADKLLAAIALCESRVNAAAEDGLCDYEDDDLDSLDGFSERELTEFTSSGGSSMIPSITTSARTGAGHAGGQEESDCFDDGAVRNSCMIAQPELSAVAEEDHDHEDSNTLAAASTAAPSSKTVFSSHGFSGSSAYSPSFATYDSTSGQNQSTQHTERYEDRLPQRKRVAMRNLFREQLREAKRRNLPVVLHSRGADLDCIKILQEELPKTHKAHMHCWSSGTKFLKKLMTDFPGMMIGVAGHVTTGGAKTWLVHPFLNDDAAYENLRDAIVENVPLDRLLVETDAPYMPPVMPEDGSLSYDLPAMSALPSMSCATVRSGRLGNLSTSLWGMIERVCLVYFTTWLDFAVGDLPVHCLLQDLSGHWTLHLTEAKSDAVEHGGKFCLHQAPNKNQENLDILKLSKAEWEAEFGGGGASVRQLQVSLTEEQSLIARQPQEHDAADGNAAHWHDLLVTDAQTGKVKGSWTPVYDEGMEIHLSEQQCGKKGDLINSDGTLPPGYASLCGQTNVGWYKDMKSGKFGCWWGEKTEAGERKLVSSFVMLRDKERKRDFQHHPLASTAGAGVSLSASLGTASTKRNKADDIFSNVADAEHRFYEAATALLFGEQQQDVETAGGTGAVGGGRSTKIGGQQNELAAAEGGEDQHQERSSTTSEAAGTSTTAVEQDLQMADLRAAAAQKFGAAVQQHLDRVHESSSPHPSITTRSHTSSKTEACNLDRRTENLQLYRNMTQMAKNFDWREQFHNKWNTDVIEQGNCGSCYVIAATYALQSRYNLRLLQAGMAGPAGKWPTGVELSEVGGDEDDAGDADEDSAGAFSAMSSIYDDLLGGAKELLPAALAETTEAGKETKSTDEIGEKRTSTEKNLVRREQSIEKAEDVQLRNKSADPETEISILQHGQEEATSTRSAKAVTRAASGRAKKTKKFILPYEVPLYCSFYNQDCDGGYPELVARHLSEFGTPEKRNVPSTSENDIDCASLLGGGSSSSAASSSSFLSSEEEHGTAEVSTAKASSRHRAGAKANSNLAYAKDYGYVGGFYGKCSEARMMHEIYHHGPVPVAVDAGSGNFEQYVAEQVAGGHHLMAPDQALVEVEYVADAELDEGVRTLVENSTSTSAPGPGAGTTTKLSVVSTAASSVAGENRRRRTTLSLPAPSISETADEPLTPKALLALVEGLSFSPPTADADSTEQDPPSAAAASLSFEDQMRERGRGSTVDATVTQKSEHAVQAALRTVRDAIHALEMAEQSGGTGTDEEGKNVLHITKVTENSINAWEYVDHAVVAVGWGETNTHPPRKYWIIRNSWGPKWGSEHSGYGYLPRGENDIGIWWDQVVSGGRGLDVLKKLGYHALPRGEND
eukprot:g4333.t1